MSAINRLVDEFYMRGTPLEEQLANFGLSSAEVEALTPLIQYLFMRANNVRLFEVTRIMTAVRKMRAFMPSPITCLLVGPVVYYIGVGEIANVFKAYRSLISATIDRRNPDLKDLSELKPAYYISAECVLRLPDGLCERAQKPCPYENYVQSLGGCNFIRRALQKQLSSLQRASDH